MRYVKLYTNTCNLQEVHKFQDLLMLVVKIRNTSSLFIFTNEQENINSGKGNSRRQLLSDPSKSANYLTSFWIYLDQNTGENVSNQNPSCILEVLVLKFCFCEKGTMITIIKISCLYYILKLQNLGSLN